MLHRSGSIPVWHELARKSILSTFRVIFDVPFLVMRWSGSRLVNRPKWISRSTQSQQTKPVRAVYTRRGFVLHVILVSTARWPSSLAEKAPGGFFIICLAIIIPQYAGLRKSQLTGLSPGHGKVNKRQNKAADFRAQSAASFFSGAFPFSLGFLLLPLSLRLSVT